MTRRPFIVGIGGTLRLGSSTESAIRGVLRHAEERGAKTHLFAGQSLDLPMYIPGSAETPEIGRVIVDALRTADAIVIGSPGYHGGISGLVKNVLDYTEELSQDALPYFSGRAVGCIATGAGWQGCNSTLAALRSVTHALRGWPTPLGIALNTVTPVFDSDGGCLQPELESQMAIMADQLLSFRRPD